MSANAIEVALGGQSLRLAVAPENEQALRDAVALVDEQLNRVRGSGPARSTERNLLMTAVALASTLLEERRQRLEDVQSSTAAREQAEAQTRIESLHAAADRLIAELGA